MPVVDVQVSEIRDWTREARQAGFVLTPEMVDQWREIQSLDEIGKEAAHRPAVPVRASIAVPPPTRVHSPGVEQWRGLVEAYFRPEDVPWAMRVMACESGGDPYAQNPRSTASGLFQFLRGWWSGAWGYPAFDPFNPEENVRAAAWLFYTDGPQHWVCK